ncbi:hypothetical protein ACCUM_3989 [Candidatus Accumulibacter phosphatis]|uniref:Uncharacterized protein n=1 Tax=Candidatus Accumulibacter phosphatis TaxID=327160 RepID=A0A5S4EMV1_9PROT|nr:hypothetical protein ACCUM_3989 [Candidatus Accumulibacter phosphatis]
MSDIAQPCTSLSPAGQAGVCLRGKATAMPPKNFFSAADAPQASDFTAFPEVCRAVGE